MCCDDSCSDTCRVVFCNITPFKNAPKDSLLCPDNTNKFILFWVKLIIYIYLFIYLLPFYRHLDNNFITTFRKNHESYTIDFFGRFERFLPFEQYNEKINIWPRNRSFSPPPPPTHLDPQVVSKFQYL